MKVTTVNQNGRIIEMNFQVEAQTEDIAYAIKTWLKDLPEKEIDLPIQRPPVPPTPKGPKVIINKVDTREPHEIINDLEVIESEIQAGLQDLKSLVKPYSITGTLSSPTPMSEEEIEAVQDSFAAPIPVEKPKPKAKAKPKAEEPAKPIADMSLQAKDLHNQQLKSKGLPYENRKGVLVTPAVVEETPEQTELDRRLSLIEKNLGMVKDETNNRMIHLDTGVYIPLNALETMREDDFENTVHVSMEQISTQTEANKAKITTSDIEEDSDISMSLDVDFPEVPDTVVPTLEVPELPKALPVMEEIKLEPVKPQLSLIEQFQQMQANALAAGLDSSKIMFQGQTEESIAKWEEYIKNYAS